MNILVTGASRGIGKVIASELIQEHSVYITARSEHLLREFNCSGYFVCDFTDVNQVNGLCSFIKDKEIDVVINNAGEYIYKNIEDLTSYELSRIIDINLKVPMLLTGAAVNYMKQNKFGRIINIGSISGVMGEAYAGAYSASKAGLIGFTKASALELAEFGITVNTINPGWVNTDLGINSISESEFTQEEILSCIPQKRFVSPYEIAGLVKYLISDEARGITGQSINICAGLSVGY